VRFSSHLIVAGMVALTGGMAAPAFAAAWTAPSWAFQSLRNPGGRYGTVLTGVSCPAVKTCFAVGAKGGKGGQTLPVAERWTGRTWAVQPSPDPARGTLSVLTGLSCSSATACIAVGNYSSESGNEVVLAERWNGRTWAIQSTPKPAGAKASTLFEVSCSSATVCTSVGVFANKSAVQQSFGERYSSGS